MTFATACCQHPAIELPKAGFRAWFLPLAQRWLGWRLRTGVAPAHAKASHAEPGPDLVRLGAVSMDRLPAHLLEDVGMPTWLAERDALMHERDVQRLLW